MEVSWREVPLYWWYVGVQNVPVSVVSGPTLFVSESKNTLMSE